MLAEPARPLNESAYKVQSLDGGHSPFEVDVYNGKSGPFCFSRIQLWTFKPAEFASR